MAGLTCSGKFEQHIELYSPKNIARMAKKFHEYEKQHGPYKAKEEMTDSRLLPVTLQEL